MARHTGPKCKLCRAEGVKLFLKGTRCDSSKCPFSQGQGRGSLPMRPGAQYGKRRRRMTEYGRQLREKQKLKRFYGTLEQQFRRYFKEATRQKGNVGVNLLTLMERRIDNAVFLSGLASSRAQARQFITHGFIYKSGKRLTIPSYTVTQGEEFEMKIAEKKAVKTRIEENLLVAKNRETPAWIDISKVKENHIFKIAALPTQEQVSAPVEVQLVIELCSK